MKWQYRGYKITCSGARDKLNIRQDKRIFSPNVWEASKKFTASIIFLEYSVPLNKSTLNSLSI